MGGGLAASSDHTIWGGDPNPEPYMTRTDTIHPTSSIWAHEPLVGAFQEPRAAHLGPHGPNGFRIVVDIFSTNWHGSNGIALAFATN